MRYAHRLAAVALLAVVTTAHIGSPDVFFDGQAGPYAVRVIVRPPQVVPGLAQVIVRAAGANVDRIVVRPVFWRVGTGGAPPGDVAKPVPGEAGTYSGNLWLMSRGAYSVYVTVQGSQGAGTAIVPVMSVATGRLGFSIPLAAILIVFGAFLVGGLVTIIYAASGESLAVPGAELAPNARRRARIIGVASVPVIAILLFGGARWWTGVDREYQRTMFRPLAGVASVRGSIGGAVLELQIRDTTGGFTGVPGTPIMPDHGKLMHLFLVRDISMADFAHLHPVQGAPMTFTSNLPPLPAGHYRLYADLVFETGEEQTVATTIDLPTPAPPVASVDQGVRVSRAGSRPTGISGDPDDAWISGGRAALVGADAVDTLGDGSTMAWSGTTDRIVAGRDLDLRFTVRDRSGAVAMLEPYMGMAAHAVIVRDDGSVFIHLHPMGTVTAGAQQAFALRDRGDTTPQGRLRMADTSAAAPGMQMAMTGTLSFPYAFPTPGRYRLWVQVKRGGVILTGPFDVNVE